ncbi:MAG: Rid family hydrolase [Gemmatimonadaceae bacterium]
MPTPKDRALVSSGSPFEASIGFSRAVRVGSLVCVAGTAPIGPDGTLVGRGDPAAQAARCFAIIEEALRNSGASLADVVRTRIYLTHRRLERRRPRPWRPIRRDSSGVHRRTGVALY